MVIWLNGGCVMMGIVVGGVELCSLYMFFRVFHIILILIMCFDITVGPNNITLGCCNNGTRYVSRNWVHWSRLVHPECNIHNNTIIVNSIEDGGDGWDGDSILLLVFILLILFGIVGMWRRRRREDVQEGGGRGKRLQIKKMREELKWRRRQYN